MIVDDAIDLADDEDRHFMLTVSGQWPAGNLGLGQVGARVGARAECDYH